MEREVKRSEHRKKKQERGRTLPKKNECQLGGPCAATATLFFCRHRGAGAWQLLFLLRETAITYYNYDVYPLWNPSSTGSKRVRRLQGSNTPVPVAFRISGLIRNGASPQTQKLKPNKWCCWEFTLWFFFIQETGICESVINWFRMPLYKPPLQITGRPAPPWIHQGLVSSMVVRLDKTMHVGYVPDVSLTIWHLRFVSTCLSKPP